MWWSAYFSQYRAPAASNIKTLLKYDNGTAGASEYVGGALPVLDETGRSWDNTLGGYPCTERSKYGVSSFLCKGQDNAFCELSSDFDLSKDFCIEGWFYSDSSGWGNILPFKVYDLASQNTLSAQIAIASRFLVLAYIDNGYYNWQVSYDDSIAQIMVQDQWIHYAFVKSGNDYYIYINGNQVAHETQTDAFPSTMYQLVVPSFSGT